MSDKLDIKKLKKQRKQKDIEAIHYHKIIAESGARKFADKYGAAALPSYLRRLAE